MEELGDGLWVRGEGTLAARLYQQGGRVSGSGAWLSSGERGGSLGRMVARDLLSLDLVKKFSFREQQEGWRGISRHNKKGESPILPLGHKSIYKFTKGMVIGKTSSS